MREYRLCMEFWVLEKSLVLCFWCKWGRVLYYIICCECCYFWVGLSDRFSGWGVVSIFYVFNFLWVGYEDVILLKGKDIGG